MMYAIVDIAGQQFKVEKDQKIYVHRLEGEAGSKLDFNKVLLIDNNQDVTVGSPVIEGAMVYASILNHLKGDKVLIFKKKRRKGYRKKNGHRQYFTQILIEDIIEKGAEARVIAKDIKPATAKGTKKEVIEPKSEVIAEPKKVVKESSAKVTAKEKPETKPAVKKTAKPVAREVKEETAAVKPATRKTTKPAAAAPAEKKAAKPADKSSATVKKETSKKTGGKAAK